MRTREWIAIAMAAAGLWGGRAWGATIESAGTGMWTNGATWVGNVAPGSGDDAVITNGCTVTMNDLVTRSVSNLTIQSGGVLTHSGPANSESAKVILNVVNNLTVDAGGTIHGNGKGYNINQGPGKLVSGTATASHGGMGAYYQSGVAGPTYGSITNPVNWGSGGRETATYGGGAVILTAGGASAINGTVSASGASSSQSYTGAGGSVFLTTGSLSGNGTIRANGGEPASGQTRCGGGGRVAVILTNSMDFGAVAFESRTFRSSPGGGGTIYLQHTNHVAGQGKLIVDYASNQPDDPLREITIQKGDGASAYAFSEIILTNGGIYGLDANDSLDISAATVRGSPANRSEGIYVNGGTLTVPSTFGLTNYFICLGNTASTFNASSLTVGTNATLRLVTTNGSWTMNAPTVEPGAELVLDQPAVFNGSLTVPAGAILKHSGNSAAETYKLNLTVNGCLEVQAGGQVGADGLGYGTGAGPYNPGSLTSGSHGGRGSYYSGRSGNTYGSITAPTNCGCGGNDSVGRYGGGAVRLTVTGAVTNNGTITANGGASGNYTGAGGSVFLTAGSLAGSGTLSANGGAAGSGYSGGGGRVAVVLTNGTDFGSVSMRALGGTTTAGAGRGAAGTVYLETPAEGTGRGRLIVNANNSDAGDNYVSTLVWSGVSDATVGTVIITNAARLVVSNATLTVYGDWVNRATFAVLTDSTVEFAGANAATVHANNTFFNLTATNADKTLVFEAGRTNTVNGLLRLGSSQGGGTVTLRSTVDGNWAYLMLTTGVGTQEIKKVSVKDSNASGGQGLLAGRGSVNNGHNVNWLFPAGGTVFVVR